MNVTLENVDKVNALLKVKIEKEDYQDQVAKSLKTMRQQAQMPGFRKGMVPTGLIKKLYGKSVTAEEVNKLLQDAVYNYIKDNKVNILGEPLPNEEKQPLVDFDTMESFEFVFDIGLAPEFTVEFGQDDKLEYCNIEVTDELINNQVEAYTHRTGSYQTAEDYQDNDMLKGRLTELNADGTDKEDGIVVEDAVLMPTYMKNQEQQALFSPLKVNGSLVFNPNAAYNGNAVELGALLKIDKEKAAKITSDFRYQVKEITRYVPGELNQELFDQVFGKDTVKTPEEFRTRIQAHLAANFQKDSQYKFLADFRKMAMQKVGKLTFPDALLKRTMLLKNQDKGQEYVDENYDKSIEELTWHLIKEKLVEKYALKVEQDDIVEVAKERTRLQFAQYGMLSVPDDMLDNYVQEMLKKKETTTALVNNVIENKLVTILKTEITLDNKTVSLEEFNKHM